jgi:hypothetical protein
MATPVASSLSAREPSARLAFAFALALAGELVTGGQCRLAAHRIMPTICGGRSICCGRCTRPVAALSSRDRAIAPSHCRGRKNRLMIRNHRRQRVGGGATGRPNVCDACPSRLKLTPSRYRRFSEMRLSLLESTSSPSMWNVRLPPRSVICIWHGDDEWGAGGAAAAEVGDAIANNPHQPSPHPASDAYFRLLRTNVQQWHFCSMSYVTRPNVTCPPRKVCDDNRGFEIRRCLVEHLLGHIGVCFRPRAADGLLVRGECGAMIRRQQRKLVAVERLRFLR